VLYGAPPFKQSIAYCVVPLTLGACHLTLRLCFKRSKKKTGHSCWRESRLACPLLISHAPPLPPPIPSNRLFIFSLLLFPNLSHLPNLFKTNTRTQHAPSRTHTRTDFFFSLHMPTFFFFSPCLYLSHPYTIVVRYRNGDGFGAPPYGP